MIFLNTELLSDDFIECQGYTTFLLVKSMDSGHALGRCLINICELIYRYITEKEMKLKREEN